MLLFLMNLQAEVPGILDLFEPRVKILTPRKTIIVLQAEKTINVLQPKKTVNVIG